MHRSLGIIIHSLSLLNYAHMSDLLLQLRLVGLPSTYIPANLCIATAYLSLTFPKSLSYVSTSPTATSQIA